MRKPYRPPSQALGPAQQRAEAHTAYAAQGRVGASRSSAQKGVSARDLDPPIDLAFRQRDTCRYFLNGRYVTGLEDQIKDLQSALAAAQATNAGCGSGATPAAPAVPTEQGLREEGQRELSHMDALLRQPNLDRLEVRCCCIEAHTFPRPESPPIHALGCAHTPLSTGECHRRALRRQ